MGTGHRWPVGGRRLPYENPPMAACPPADTLSRFLLDVLRGEELAAVETHVDACGPCQATLHHLSRLADGPAAEGTPPWQPDAAEVDLPAGATNSSKKFPRCSRGRCPASESRAPGQRTGGLC